MNNKLFVVAGPTGTGKSIFAVDLALRIGGEIVCADAYQIYRGMAILTAQPEKDLTRRVPHHLYGCVSPSEGFDAAKYAALAHTVVQEIHSRGKPALLVGGSGLYLRAFFGGLNDAPPPDPQVRTQVRELSHAEALALLAKKDPMAPAQIDVQNPRRVARALEIVLQTGLPLATSRTSRRVEMDGIYLNRQRDELYARIADNVRHLLQHGAVQEVSALPAPGPTASHAIGLAEICSCLGGKFTLEETEALIVKATRRYAKRQLTWFRNQTTLREVIPSTSRPYSHRLDEVVSIVNQ